MAKSTGLLNDPSAVADKEFDYIVVGAGAAGCVLAHRLSDDGKHTVLLVEAGGNHEDETFTKIPAAFARLFKSKADWNYATVPQPNLNGRELYHPRGRLLGGSTSINAMMYQHATPQDFQEWASKGATGWGYEDMKPYFRKAERYTPHAAHTGVQPEHRGDSGYWHTGFSHSHPTTDAFVETCASLGIEKTEDINTPKGALGVNHFVTFIDAKGRRSSAATAYLPAQVLARPNISVLLNTLTTKIILEKGGNPKASGIEIAKAKDGPKHTVRAKKEVILSAGSINTPQLLMLSGIGPGKALNDIGIPLAIENSHVGAHLFDHLAVPLIFRSKDSLDYLAHPIKSLPALVKWMIGSGGPMTTNVAEAAAFIRLDQSAELTKSSVTKLPAEVPKTASGAGSPDIEILSAPLCFIDHGFEQIPKGNKAFTLGPTHIRPSSEGNVTLKSADPWDAPLMDPNYFSDRRDIEALIRASRACLRIARAKPLADHLILGHKPSEDTDDFFFITDSDPDTLSDEHLERWIRRKAQTLYHPVGTARIAASAEGGVVDPQLKVFGVEGLRVVDASVFPAQISGHPTATIIAIAEKASEIILTGA